MFDSLPNELILEIFYASLKDDTDGYPNALWCLAQVCVRWRDLVLSHPDFWSVIDQSFGQRWLQWVAKRAAGLPLTYIIQPAAVFDDIAAHKLLDYLQTNMRPCDNLIIRRDARRHVPDVLGRILEAPPPGMHSFVIDTTRDQRDYDYNHVELLHSNIRGVQFRLLSVLQNVFRWNSPLAKNLTGLELSGPLNGHDTPPIPFLELLCTIQESPSLQVFDAYVISVTPLPPLHSLPSAVQLLNLESFSVASLDREVLTATLSCIKAPNCSTVRLVYHMGGQSLGPELNTLMLCSVFYGVGERVEDVTTDVSMDQGLDSLLFKWEDGLSKVSITLEFLDSPDRLNTLQNILGVIPDSLCPYVLYLEVAKWWADSFAGILPILEGKFRGVKNLLLAFEKPEDWEETVVFLSGSQGPLPWPSLSLFFVDAGPSCRFQPSHFLDVLRPRAESWSHRNDDDPENLQVAKLSRMEVQGGYYEGFRSTEVEEIDALVHERVEFYDL